MLGLYIHIPFCARKCNYCDFYSIPGKTGLLGRYVEALLQEADKYAGMQFDTIYVGGGTPSLLGPSRLETLVKGLLETLDLKHLQEFTIEANPESADPELLDKALSLGVNRLSIGVQSLDEDELRKAGRIHDAITALEAIDNAVRCGFTNISADVIIGLPGQTDRKLSRTLGLLSERPLTHLSAYCLSVEENTPFGVNPPADLVDEDTQAALFETAAEYLKQHGFVHYEISNFALPGRECLHNLNYWRGGEYVGLGTAAASHINGRRLKNSADLDRYLENPLSIDVEMEELASPDKMAEEAMLRLRLLEEGLDMADLGARYTGVSTQGLTSRLDGMAAEKALVKSGGKYRIPPAGVLTSNQVFVKVLN